MSGKNRRRVILTDYVQREKMFYENLGTAMKVASMMTEKISGDSFLGYDDFRSIAVIRLWDITKTYDGQRGLTFSNFAWFESRNAILDSIRQLDRVPRSVRSCIKRVNEAYDKLSQKLQREPKPHELRKACRLSLSQWEQVQSDMVAVEYPISLYEKVGENEDIWLLEVLPDTNSLSPCELTAQEEEFRMVRENIRTLPEKNRELIELYYFRGLVLREIAKIIGMTESRACQIINEARSLLRNKLGLLSQNY